MGYGPTIVFLPGHLSHLKETRIIMYLILVYLL